MNDLIEQHATEIKFGVGFTVQRSKLIDDCWVVIDPDGITARFNSLNYALEYVKDYFKK